MLLFVLLIARSKYADSTTEQGNDNYMDMCADSLIFELILQRINVN